MLTGPLAIVRSVLPRAAAATLVLLLDASPAAAGATASASINGATDADAGAATAEATATGGGPSATGDAVASADVTTGTLRARTNGTTPAGPGSFLDADASALIEEAVFLVPDTGSPSTPVSFTIFMDLDGELLVSGSGIPTSGNLQSASARASAQLGITGFLVTGVSPASFTVTRVVQAAGGIVQADDTTAQVQQNTIGLVGSAFDVRLTASAMVTPNSAFTVRAAVNAESGAEAGFSSVADMLNTGQLGVSVPNGYTLASSSGLFLTVPEPGAASAGAALATLAALRARRRLRGPDPDRPPRDMGSPRGGVGSDRWRSSPASSARSTRTTARARSRAG